MTPDLFAKLENCINEDMEDPFYTSPNEQLQNGRIAKWLNEIRFADRGNNETSGLLGAVAW